MSPRPSRSAGWGNPFTIVHRDDTGTPALGDNQAFMQSLPDASCGLFYADPPYMTERRRITGRDAAGFDDRVGASIDAYLAFLRPRCGQMHRALSERGRRLSLVAEPAGGGIMAGHGIGRGKSSQAGVGGGGASR